MKNSIQTKKKRLIFRDDAKRLIRLVRQKVKEEKLKVAYLDFSSVDFMSRSFVDEFLNGLSDLEKVNVKVQFLNLQTALQEFILRVKNVKSKIRKTILNAHKK